MMAEDGIPSVTYVPADYFEQLLADQDEPPTIAPQLAAAVKAATDAPAFERSGPCYLCRVAADRSSASSLSFEGLACW